MAGNATCTFREVQHERAPFSDHRQDALRAQRPPRPALHAPVPVRQGREGGGRRSALHDHPREGCVDGRDVARDRRADEGRVRRAHRGGQGDAGALRIASPVRQGDRVVPRAVRGDAGHLLAPRQEARGAAAARAQAQPLHHHLHDGAPRRHGRLPQPHHRRPDPQGDGRRGRHRRGRVLPHGRARPAARALRAAELNYYAHPRSEQRTIQTDSPRALAIRVRCFVLSSIAFFYVGDSHLNFFL